jgi:hypothetical protein
VNNSIPPDLELALTEEQLFTFVMRKIAIRAAFRFGGESREGGCSEIMSTFATS